MIRKILPSKQFIRRILIVCGYLPIFALFIYAPVIFNVFLPHRRSVSVYMFPSMIDPNLFDEFEMKTGIHVYVKHFDFNPELQTKMQMSEGAGYDLVTPSDYNVGMLAEEGLLLPLDTSKLSNFADLDKRLLNREFDPENKFSVPVCWGAYGIGFDKQWLGDLPYPDSLAAIFEPDKFWSGPLWEERAKEYKVCVMDDPREVIFFASFYLYGNVDDFSSKRLSEIKELLLSQRKFVGGYAESNLQYYLSGVYPVALSNGSVMKRMLHESDRFGFVVPKEGSILTIENLAIPSRAENVEDAYKLIDFLISAKSGADSFNEYGFCPANKKSYAYIDKRFTDDSSMFPTGTNFSNLHLLHAGLSVRDAHELWTDIKSR